MQPASILLAAAAVQPAAGAGCWPAASCCWLLANSSLAVDKNKKKKKRKQRKERKKERKKRIKNLKEKRDKRNGGKFERK